MNISNFLKRKVLFSLLIFFPSFSISEVINLKCFNEVQEQHGYIKTRVVRFSLGEFSKLARMSAKGYPLVEFDLDITPTHYLIGQYKSASKEDLITIFSINKTTLTLEQDSFFSQQNAPKDRRSCVIE